MKPKKYVERTHITWTPTLLERLRAYADDRELTLSDAVRLLVASGLDAAKKDGAR